MSQGSETRVSWSHWVRGFGGWKKSGFGDLNQHGPDAFRFYTRTKTVTARWPSGIKEGGEFNFKAME